MRKINMNDVQEAGEYRRPEAGAYICKITKAVDYANEQYLEISYDIDDGEYKGYYEDMRARGYEWAGKYRKYYKDKAIPFFKRFCTAVSRSNGNYVFDAGEINCDEQTLIGKRVGLLFQEEEYYGNDGTLKTRLNVFREFSVDKLDQQKTPAKITAEAPATASSASVFVDAGTDEELPFA